MPASIDVIDSSVMEARGYRRSSDAVETTPGVVVGQNPAAPSSFSMRGFTRSQVTVLRDGIDQRLVGDRVFLDVRTPTPGGENRMAIGLEVSALDFERTRGFRIEVPQVPGDGVDLLDPEPGVYGPRELRGIAPTYIDSRAFFIENSLPLASRVRVAGALRYEAMDLERVNLNAAHEPEGGGFERAFRWWSWRAGAVVDLRSGLVAYGPARGAG